MEKYDKVRRGLKRQCEEKYTAHAEADVYYTRHLRYSTYVGLFLSAIAEAGIFTIMNDKWSNIYVKVGIALLIGINILTTSYISFRNLSDRTSKHHSHSISNKRILDRIKMESMKPEAKRYGEPEFTIDIMGDVTALENTEPLVPGFISKKIHMMDNINIYHESNSSVSDDLLVV